MFASVWFIALRFGPAFVYRKYYSRLLRKIQGFSAKEKDRFPGPFRFGHDLSVTAGRFRPDQRSSCALEVLSTTNAAAAMTKIATNGRMFVLSPVGGVVSSSVVGGT